MFMQKLPTNYHKTLIKVCVSIIIVMSLLYNVTIQDDGTTCLMAASGRGYVDIVRILLEAKADPNITDEVKLRYSHC